MANGQVIKYTIKIAPETILLTVAALLGAYLLIQFLSAVRFVVTVFLLALILAQAVEPLVGIIERARVPRVFAVVIAYLIALQIFLVIGALVVPPLLIQLQTLIVNLPTLFMQLQAILSAYYNLGQLGVPQQLQEAVTQLTTNLAQALPALLLLPLQVGYIVVAGVTVVILSIYWLLISRDVKQGIVGLFPPEQQREVDDIITEMAVRVGGWVRGQIILSTTIGLLTYIGLALLDVPFAVVLAVWAGFMEFVPMVGPILAAIPAIIVALFISPLEAFLVIVLYIVIQQIENHLVVPNVMSREVGLQPVVVILAILAGAELMGIVGALLAVPLAAAFQVLVVRSIELLRGTE